MVRPLNPRRHVLNVGIVPAHGDPRRLRLCALARVGRQVLLDAHRVRREVAPRHRGRRGPARDGRGERHARGGGGGDEGGSGGETRAGDPPARPRRERGPLGADLDPHLCVAPLDLVVFQDVEVDHDADDARPELGIPEVPDAAAILTVVQGRRRHETRPHQVHDQTSGTPQREVLDFDGPLKIDDDRHFAGSREHADAADLTGAPAHAPSSLRPRNGSGCRRDDRQRGEGSDALHGVTSCLASCRLSCRSKPNSCTVNTISRGRICVTLRRPMTSPVLARYRLPLVTSRSTATLRAG